MGLCLKDQHSFKCLLFILYQNISSCHQPIFNVFMEWTNQQAIIASSLKFSLPTFLLLFKRPFRMLIMSFVHMSYHSISNNHVEYSSPQNIPYSWFHASSNHLGELHIYYNQYISCLYYWACFCNQLFLQHSCRHEFYFLVKSY